MSKTLSELNDEDAYKLGDIYECTLSDSSLYNEGDLYAVVEGFSGDIGIQINGNSKNICRVGDVEFKLVEPKVATTKLDNPKVTREEFFYLELTCETTQLTRQEAEQLRDQLNEVLK